MCLADFAIGLMYISLASFLANFGIGAAEANGLKTCTSLAFPCARVLTGNDKL